MLLYNNGNTNIDINCVATISFTLFRHCFIDYNEYFKVILININGDCSIMSITLYKMHFSGKEQGNSSTQGSGAEYAPCSMIHK